MSHSTSQPLGCAGELIGFKAV
uniref:Uncharacterized protein n=1 Tax=Lepeophtheirus salmonis TaxID=72036 RepID=A0A0K2UYC4_LEPSM